LKGNGTENYRYYHVQKNKLYMVFLILNH